MNAIDAAARRDVLGLSGASRLLLANVLEQQSGPFIRWWLKQPTVGEKWDPSMASPELKYKQFREQLPELLWRMEMEEIMTENAKRNNLERLNDQLFEELDNLRMLDLSDAQMVEAEIRRAKAFESIAKTVIDNTRVAIEGARTMADFGNGTIKAPKMLEG